ncbi:MAG: metallophosphoesterase [Planctomycetaceae bacterium]|nr:metallophosphoesterase [Planctomycetaceae bacterium]
MTKRLVLLMCVVALAVRFAAAADVPAAVSGVVYLDANGNGKLDAGEKPLAGVRVTDGVNIVTSAADGTYTVKIAPDPTTPQAGSRVVAINWPSETWPSGKWWARLDQITDAAHVNFGLRQEKQALPFAFMHVSDDHAAGATYNLIGPAAGRLKPLLRFCINTSDSAGDVESTARLAANAAKFVVPVMTVPGNHDIVGGHGVHRLEQTPVAGNGSYTTNMGAIRWSFDYAGVHFVGLDWMDPSIPEDVNGSVPQVAADWLEKDLAAVKPGTRIFAFVHFPTGCQKYYDLIAKYKVAHVFGGHNHEHRFYNFGGVPAVTAINFMAGGNLIIVQENDFTLGEFCLGYKGPDHHIKRCSLAKMPAVLGTSKAREVAPQSLATKSLSGAAAPIATPGAKGVRIAMELTPGTASKVGIKIAASPKPVEIVWTGTQIEIAGVPVPSGWEDYDGKTLLWNVLIDGARIDFYANKRHHLAKALKVDAVESVTFFADGGAATVKKAEVFGLK